jgi:hypothetical protein
VRMRPPSITASQHRPEKWAHVYPLPQRQTIYLV